MPAISQNQISLSEGFGDGLIIRGTFCPLLLTDHPHPFQIANDPPSIAVVGQTGGFGDVRQGEREGTVDVATVWVKGATAVIMKSAGIPIRKNAAEIAIGQGEPLFKAAEYGDAIIERSVEIAAQTGTTPEKALLDHCGTDSVLIELACGERAAEMAIMKAASDRLFGT